MKTSAPRRNDGGRQRCTGCGHPRVEHRLPQNCTVPKCPCVGYAPQVERLVDKRTKA